MKKFYAVKNGKIPGIYFTWDDCKKQVDGFSGAEYKSFTNLEDAKDFVTGVTKTNSASSAATAYVDGSFNIESLNFSYGIVLLYNGEELHFSKAFQEPELASMRNVAGEIFASQFIMQYCLDNDIESIDIYYDYEGIEKWCTGAWKTNKTGTKNYADFYNSIKDKLRVNFIKVKSHSGDKYNDIADKLAKEALGIK